MAKKNTNLRGSGRQKVKKQPVDQSASPFKKELKNDRNKKAVIIGVVVIVVVMIGSMIVPYLGGQSSTYSLPETALKQDETPAETEGFNAQDISLGQTFNRVDKEYIVVFGSMSDTSELSGKITRDTLYTVDKDKFVNKSLTEKVSDGKEKPKEPKDIKIDKDVALIKIKDGKTVEFFNTKKEVENYIKDLK